MKGEGEGRVVEEEEGIATLTVNSSPSLTRLNITHYTLHYIIPEDSALDDLWHVFEDIVDLLFEASGKHLVSLWAEWRGIDGWI